MKLCERKRIVMVLGALAVSSMLLGNTCVEAARHPAERRPAKLPKHVGCEEKQSHERDVIGVGEIQITAFDMASSNYALARSGSANGNISGSGVRLRKFPKANATVLELLYNKESVRINYTKSARESNGNWYYVRRVKTGTWGWINHQYLCHLD